MRSLASLFDVPPQREPRSSAPPFAAIALQSASKVKLLQLLQ